MSAFAFFLLLVPHSSCSFRLVTIEDPVKAPGFSALLSAQHYSAGARAGADGILLAQFMRVSVVTS